MTEDQYNEIITIMNQGLYLLKAGVWWFVCITGAGIGLKVSEIIINSWRQSPWGH